MNLPSILQTKKFKWLVLGLSATVVLLLVFQLGMFVGYRKAAFTFRWGENYHRVFGGPKEGFLKGLESQDFINGHGTAGEVLSVSNNSLVVKGQSNVEKVITVDGTTVIRKGWQTLNFSELKAGDRIVAIGAPKEDGSVAASFIRVFDPAEPFGPGPGPMPMPGQSFPNLNK